MPKTVGIVSEEKIVQLTECVHCPYKPKKSYIIKGVNVRTIVGSDEKEYSCSIGCDPCYAITSLRISDESLEKRRANLH